MPLLMNDEAVAPGLEDVGVSRADAWNYCIAGCNEIGIPGRATTTAISLAGLVDVAVLNRVLHESPSEIGSADALLAAYEARSERDLRGAMGQGQRRLADLAERGPFPFTSACCEGPAQAGADYLQAMPYRHISCVYVRGTVNAVNALAAVDRVVFQERRMTLAELAAALERDDEAVLATLAAAPKWGNDDPEADRWAVRLHEARERALERLSSERGAPLIVCHVIRSLHHLSGRPLGATPDGRRAGEPLADSVGAAAGTAREGPTALLNSVLKLNARRFYKGAYNLNLTLSSGQAAPAVLAALCRAFFLDGGQEVQISVLDAAKLRAARDHPEAFQDLVVRIAGLNARFVELSRVEQDEMIRRAEAVA
jgi:formate C-acetyltransferase